MKVDRGGCQADCMDVFSLLSLIFASSALVALDISVFLSLHLLQLVLHLSLHLHHLCRFLVLKTHIFML